MCHLRRFLPFLLVPLGLVAVSMLLQGGPAAFAEDKPTPPAGGEPGGMSEPGMDGGEADKPDPDDEESDAPPALNERVKQAIKKGITWLKNHQASDGSWGNIEGTAFYGGAKTGNAYKHPAGATALALYTLLKCKVPMDDPYIRKGFKFLKDKYPKPGSSYEASMMLLAVTATADPFKKFSASSASAEAQKVKLSGEWLAWATSLKDHLLTKRKGRQGWRYNIEQTGKGGGDSTPGGDQDLSSTQLATLALLAAERCNVKVDSKVWLDIADFSGKQQQDDGPEWERAVYDRKTQAAKKDEPSSGGDGYSKPKPNDPTKSPKDRARGFAYIKSDKLSPDEGQATGGMTACGVANIQMARYILIKRKDASWESKDADALQRVYDGCAWLDQNWSPAQNPGKKSENVYHIYYMYCVERAFDLIGNQRLGGHMWYVEMAEQLVGMQRDKGFWNSNSTHKPEEVLDTCFALLVLKQASRGGIPYGSVTNPGDEPPVDNRGK